MRLAATDDAYTYSHEIWEHLCETLEITNPQIIPQSQWAGNGSVYEALLHSTEYDVTFDAWVMTRERLMVTNFSAVVQQYKYAIHIQNRRMINEQWFEFAQLSAMFSPHLWYVIGAAGVLLAATNWTIAGPSERSSVAWSWLAHYLGHQSMEPAHSSVHQKLLLLASGLLTMHSIHLYQGSMLSHLVQPTPYKPPFKDLTDVAELIRSGRAVLNLKNPDYAVAMMLRESLDSSAYRGLREALAQNPAVYLIKKNPTHARKMKELQNSGKFFITITPQDMAFDEVTEENCAFVFVPLEGQRTAGFVFGRALNASMRQRIDHAIQTKTNEILALLNRFVDLGTRTYERCREEMFERQAPAVGDAIRLMRLSPVIIVWTGGSLAGLGFLIIEWVHRWNRGIDMQEGRYGEQFFY